jgi:hypothetical protein
MLLLWQILGLLFTTPSFAFDPVITPKLLAAALNGLNELNGVEFTRMKCPVVLGPADPSGPIEPVCLKLAAFPEGQLKAQNCLEAFRRIENKDALRWTLEYFVRNQGGIKDPRCFLDDHELDKLKVGSKKWKAAAKEQGISWIRFGETRNRPEWDRMAKARGVELKDLKQDIAARGIENGCQIMMNDFSRACDADAKGPFGYWIDLCSKEGNAVRELEVVKKGTGTCANGFLDVPDKNTTVAGAFLTGEYSDHKPYHMDKGYKALEADDVLKKVVVFGMNESNNDSYWDKHVHVSPYFTSSGCPAINREDVDIIAEMGKAQTLVVNYGPARFHQALDDCHNGDGGKK